MAAFVIELYSNVLHSCFEETPVCAQNALAVFANRICIAGHEINGQILFHTLQIAGLGYEFNTAHHIMEKACAGDIAAKGIFDILIDLGLVPAEPVGDGAGGLEAVIILAECQIVEHLAFVFGALFVHFHLAHQLASKHKCLGLLSCAGENNAVKTAAEIDYIRACKEGAHAVAEKKAGNARELVNGDVVELAHVLDSHFPAAVFREKAQLGLIVYALPVAKMVVAEYNKAVFGEERFMCSAIPWAI